MGFDEIALILRIELHHEAGLRQMDRADDLAANPERRNAVMIRFGDVGQGKGQPPDLFACHIKRLCSNAAAMKLA